MGLVNAGGGKEESREDSRRAHWAVNVVGRGMFRGTGNFHSKNVSVIRKSKPSSNISPVSLLYNLVLQLIYNYLS